MPKPKLKKIGGCVGRNGYWGVYGFEFDACDNETVDIIFKGTTGRELNAGGHVDIPTFITEASKMLDKLGFIVVSKNTSRVI